MDLNRICVMRLNAALNRPLEPESAKLLRKQIMTRVDGTEEPVNFSPLAMVALDGNRLLYLCDPDSGSPELISHGVTDEDIEKIHLMMGRLEMRRLRRKYPLMDLRKISEMAANNILRGK